ncbi:MAG: Eco57I restriction-modification methylase domain-containing protein [Verrucomicrobia bacterium]|nr:Eco57I restriction-modification methylase domain-containing protein [Verrucomicrobiota bacterium]
MRIDTGAVRRCLKSFDFDTLFREHLGWDNHQAQLDIPVDSGSVILNAVAQKRGFVAFVCASIPDRPTRLKIDHKVTKSAREHFVIYTDEAAGRQVWQWVRRETGKPLASRDHRFDVSQSGDPLIQRLDQIAVSLDEEEDLTLPDIAGRIRSALDVDKVTKKFYDRFKTEHTAFMKLIKGIKTDPDLQWYTSLMLNRVMFVYFIQKKGFLDGDTDYLRNRLAMVRDAKGKDKFQSFYRYFLLRLFHEGLGKHRDERKLDPAMEKLLGKVPYLNGGFFEVHQLEENNRDIDIPDKAFEKLFDFFDDYRWHLDERPLRKDDEINPDVVGYIFEKYINQKQMGAYYTKEDITEYISKNTILPYLFDAARKKCAVAFKPDSAMWRLLRDDPDRYIYPAVRHGVIDDKGKVISLPKDIAAGIKDVSKRDGWNRSAEDPYALPTETWREHVARRQRCLDIRKKLSKGDVHEINDLITLNLDIWQFARDAIVNAEGPELLRAFWHTIAGRLPEKSSDKMEPGITILDPTCGSGAFLFAALRILETLYSDCLERMQRFLEDIADKPHHPKQFSDFKRVLDGIGEHRSERYFVLKSIIINNLFGVDIMEEAVEICKLRLFLKLVAQVETFDQIEPLPDVDFNIRAGNTLVGYASADQGRRAFTEERAGKNAQGRLMLGTAEDDYERFEEDLEKVDRAFQQFRAQQTTHGGKVTPEDKQELRERLAKLDAELDRYLASEYGLDVEKKRDFDAWRNSHEPFHWFVEFYGIMRGGGFDVIIGNPPYVEYSKVRKDYALRSEYNTLQCGNIYTSVCERGYRLIGNCSRFGMIVPLSSVSTRRMAAFRDLWSSEGLTTYASHYSGDAHPSVLFNGVKFRLTILLQKKGGGADTFSTHFQRWYAEARDFLFPQVAYEEFAATEIRKTLHPKICSSNHNEILSRLCAQRVTLGSIVRDKAPHSVYCHRIVAHFVKAFDFVPFFESERDGRKKSEDYKVFSVENESLRATLTALLNSSLFYCWFVTYSDVYHCGREIILDFPTDLPSLDAACGEKLASIVTRLMANLKQNSVRREIPYKATGIVKYDEFYPRESKPIIDEIDRMLAKHYGFTDEELDFIINYDIKYRMGGTSEMD